LWSEGTEIKDSKNNGFIYASKKGKKYYFYNCKSSIKEENKIYFNTEDEAKESGRTLASGCK
jgi:methylphosphotriester-DNA--protein-cysteine methyltransferase